MKWKLYISHWSFRFAMNITFDHFTYIKKWWKYKEMNSSFRIEKNKDLNSNWEGPHI